MRAVAVEKMTVRYKVNKVRASKAAKKKSLRDLHEVPPRGGTLADRRRIIDPGAASVPPSALRLAAISRTDATASVRFPQCRPEVGKRTDRHPTGTCEICCGYHVPGDPWDWELLQGAFG
jgi:hypothetical protein